MEPPNKPYENKKEETKMEPVQKILLPGKEAEKTTNHTKKPH